MQLANGCRSRHTHRSPRNGRHDFAVVRRAQLALADAVRVIPSAPVRRPLGLALAILLLPAGASAQEGEAVDPAVARELSALTRRGTYLRLFATAMVGEGMRFNNPYRLSKQLGKTGESLSLTAPYSDLGGGITFGPPDGLQHGAFLSWSEALSGVPQTVITPSYVALYRGPNPFMLWGRAGVPVILGPDPNAGFELAASFAYFVTAGIGASASLVGSGYYGAGTREVKAAFYPVLSGQLGLIVDYEVLP